MTSKAVDELAIDSARASGAHRTMWRARYASSRGMNTSASWPPSRMIRRVRPSRSPQVAWILDRVVQARLADRIGERSAVAHLLVGRRKLAIT